MAEVQFVWQPILPELLLLASAVLVPMLSFALKGTRAAKDMGWITLFILGGAFAMVSVMMFTGDHLGSIAYDLFEVTAFSQFLKMVFLGVAILVTFVSIEYIKDAPNVTEYYTLLIVATLGMMVVASARDFMTLFIGIETASISSYILAGYLKGEKSRIEASTKYFIIGSLSSGVMLFGMSLLYGAAGTLEFDAMQSAIVGNSPVMLPITLVSIVLILVGLGFKTSSAPFHMWAPDVYHGSPDTVSAFLSAGSKVMGFAAIMRVFLIGLAGMQDQWQVLLAFIAVASMTVGNLAALKQTSMKRMLGYSSIAHAGYIMLAIVVGSEYAIAGGLFHFVTDATMKATAFLAVAAVAAYGIGDALSDYKGLRVRSPFLAFTLAIVMFSLAGIPPFAGFASKFALFSSAVYAGVEGGPSWLVWLAIAGIVNSLISAFYYARVIRYMYGEKAEDTSRIHLPNTTGIALLLGLVMIFAFGLWPDLVLTRAFEAAQVFIGA